MSSEGKRSPLYCGFSFSTRSWCGSVNTPLKWNTRLSGSNVYLSVFAAWNSLWTSYGGNCLFLPPFSLPCYSLYLLTLTSSTLKLPHSWCSGSAFPNINLTHAFSSFYISPSLSLPPAIAFLLPELIGLNRVVAGLKERWWWLGHVSNTGQAFPESCWGWMCWEMSCEAWAASEQITVCCSSTGKVCTVRTHSCPVLFIYLFFLWLGRNDARLEQTCSSDGLSGKTPASRGSHLYINLPGYKYIFEYKARFLFVIFFPNLALV